MAMVIGCTAFLPALHCNRRFVWQGEFSRKKRITRAVSSSSTDEERQISICLKDLSDSLILPADFLKTLPNDLQVDVKDAAFALSKGPVYQECGTQVGDILQQLAKAWEQSDTETVARIGKSFTTLEGAIDRNNNGPALGRRLISAGRRFKCTGQYAQGEFQDIARALMALGEAVGGKEAPSSDISSLATTLKFGSLQVDITRSRAFSGAAIALAFAVLSWKLGVAVQDLSESASDNIAGSLRGTLLAMAYSCSALSAFTGLGLLFLGLQFDRSNAEKKKG